MFLRKDINKTKGFTLIELMLATSLLMIVMFSGYYAYSLYSQKWQKRVQSFWKSTEQAVALDMLNKISLGALPYIVSCDSDISCVYFKGNSSHVSFVTKAAIYSAGPALVELSLVPVSDGRVHLLYREQEIASRLILSLEHEVQWQHETVLLANISSVNFSFFGWESYSLASEQISNESVIVNDSRGWYQNHQASKSRLLPEIIRFEFNHYQGNTSYTTALPQHSIYRLLNYIRVDV